MTSQFERERELQAQMEAALTPAMEQVDVVDVELDQPHELVRLFIDHPEGVTHKLCADVTFAVREVCPEYALEVSSPGIERPLRRLEHFSAAVGKRIKLRKRGSKRAFTATIEAAEDGEVLVRREDSSEERIALHDIARARLVVSFEAVPKGQPHSTRDRKGMQA